jgi:hypothetical protein
MITRLTGFVRGLFRIEPFQFTEWEVVCLRLIFAWLLIDSIPSGAGVYPDTPYPRGLAHFMNLSFMHDPSAVKWLSVSATWTLIVGAFGVAEPLMLGWTLFVVCASMSYNMSQGALGHAGQLHALCLLAWWLASLWALRGGWKKVFWAGSSSWSTQVWCIIQTIAASYTVSAITKMVNSGGTWPFRGSSFVLQMMKAQDERITSYDIRARDFAYAAVDVLQHHAWLGSMMLCAAWMLEFFAFLALLNRRMSLCIGLGLLAFHHSTELLMTIGFGTHRQLLWLFMVNPVFWVVSLFVRGKGSSHGDPVLRPVRLGSVLERR